MSPFRTVRRLCEHTFVSEACPEQPAEARKRHTNGHEELRRCRRHGVVVFHLYVQRSGRREYKCKRCVGEAVTRRHRRLKALLVKEAGGCCAVCGYSKAINNLCFHHVDPRQKSFPMTMARGKSEAAYRRELAKCVLVCANCHGEIESGLIASPPAGAHFRAA